jgi:hypothetical protein
MTDIRYPYQGAVAGTDGQGLVIDPITGQLTLVLDGTSLSKSASGLKWNDGSTQFIDVSSATEAFRITQRGSGAALLVEDSTNPDASPFVVDSLGNVGVGTTTPGVALDVNGQISANNAITASNPNNALATFSLSWLNDVPRFRIGGSGIGSLAGMDIQGPGNVSYLRVTGVGRIGIGTATPSNQLSVVGSADITGSLGIGTTNPPCRLSVFENSASSAVVIRQLGTGLALRVEDSTNPDSSPFVIDADGNVGIGLTTPTSSLHLGQTTGVADAATIQLAEKDTTPANPDASIACKIYMKSDKLVIQYNDGGTVRYKYLDLTGTTVTWVADTVAP